VGKLTIANLFQQLLFDFDGESCLTSIAQGTLLLSYCSPIRNYPRSNTFWLGIAIHFSKQADAHRYQTKRNVSEEHRNTLKRLWWCCVLRDRILALGVRRQLQITSGDCEFNNQKPLVAEDFECEIRYSKVYDAATKHSLVQLLVALCSL